MNTPGKDFARAFMGSVLSLAREVIGQKWERNSGAMFRAQVHSIARDNAYRYGVSLDAADALAEYALLTLTFDGRTLDDREARDREAADLESRAAALRYGR